MRRAHRCEKAERIVSPTGRGVGPTARALPHVALECCVGRWRQTRRCCVLKDGNCDLCCGGDGRARAPLSAGWPTDKSAAHVRPHEARPLRSGRAATSIRMCSKGEDCTREQAEWSCGDHLGSGCGEHGAARRGPTAGHNAVLRMREAARDNIPANRKRLEGRSQAWTECT